VVMVAASSRHWPGCSPTAGDGGLSGPGIDSVTFGGGRGECRHEMVAFRMCAHNAASAVTWGRSNSANSLASKPGKLDRLEHEAHMFGLREWVSPCRAIGSPQHMQIRWFILV
jgi:hypothetical protein